MKTVLEDCHLCGQQESLVKLPSIVRIVDSESNINFDERAGTTVRQHIEEARQEIRQDKEIMSQDYEP